MTEESSFPTLIVDVASASDLQLDNNKLQHIEMCVLFNSEMRRSEKYIASPNVDFNFTVQFNIERLLSSVSLLKVETPIVLYLSTIEYDDSKKPHSSLLCSAVIDFRHALITSDDYLNVELLPCNGATQLLVSGSLFLRLTLDNTPHLRLPPADIETAISSYQSKLTSLSQEFFQFSRQWWKKTLAAYPWLQTRIIKLLAHDEASCARCVCSLLAPISPARQLPTPRFAARFVSLLPFHRDISLTGGRNETWKSALGTLATRSGDIEDHALLLCSLLLGWNMHAYVALGTMQAASHQKPYCWVITLDAAHVPTHWEPVTGQQYSSTSHPFVELHMLFNHESLLINIQKNALISTSTTTATPTNFDTTNEKYFISMPKFWHHHLTHPGAYLSLTPSRLFVQEEAIEMELRDLLVEWRLQHNLHMAFDSTLEGILQVCYHAMICCYL